MSRIPQNSQANIVGNVNSNDMVEDEIEPSEECLKICDQYKFTDQSNDVRDILKKASYQSKIFKSTGKI